MELRSNGTVLRGLSGNALASGIVSSMTPELLLDLIGVRLNGRGPRTFEIEVELVVVDAETSDGAWCSSRCPPRPSRRARTSAPVGVISSIAAFAVFATGSKKLR